MATRGPRMSPADAVWFLGEDDHNPMVISAVLWFDGPLEVDRLRKLIDGRLLGRHPVFRQRIVPSRNPLLLPRWVDDDDFDLDAHLSVSDLPPPGDHAVLEDVCSRQRSTPLDRRRPLWHVDVLQGYRGDDSVLHVRMHHSISDGLAAMRVLLALSDGREDEDVQVGPTPTAGPLERVAQLARLGSSPAFALARHPNRAGGYLRGAVDAARWSTRLLVAPRPPASVLLGELGGDKRMAWDPDGIPLSDVRRFAREHEATVNDVVLTLFAGALHRYLADHDSVVDDALLTVPIDLRPPDEELPAHLGNRIGLLPIVLPVGSSTSSERLAAVRAKMEELKRSPAPVLSRALLSGTALVTPVVERWIHRLNQARGTGVVTNVRGPQEPLHLAGARLRGVIGWGGMTASLNVNASFVSLGDRLFAGIVTDEAVTPDPARIVTYVQDEWDDLRASVSV